MDPVDNSSRFLRFGHIPRNNRAGSYRFTVLGSSGYHINTKFDGTENPIMVRTLGRSASQDKTRKIVWTRKRRPWHIIRVFSYPKRELCTVCILTNGYRCYNRRKTFWSLKSLFGCFQKTLIEPRGFSSSMHNCATQLNKSSPKNYWDLATIIGLTNFALEPQTFHSIREQKTSQIVLSYIFFNPQLRPGIIFLCKCIIIWYMRVLPVVEFGNGRACLAIGLDFDKFHYRACKKK